MLDVNGLTIEFLDEDPPFLAVKDVSLHFKEGEIVGLVGESGSGKSQTALAIAGLIKRNKARIKGEILWEGRDLMTIPRKELRELQGKEIGYIFQDPLTSLNPLMTIGWQVEEALRLHTELSKEEMKEKAVLALQDAGLPEPERVYHSYPFELSGGMRQRSLIAAAIITHPKLLIADEPTTALDVTVQAQIIELLLHLHEKYQLGILFISHDLSLIRKLCSRVLVMKDGTVVEEGKVEDIFRSPKEEYTRKLIDSIPDEPTRDAKGKSFDGGEVICEVKDYSFFYQNRGKKTENGAGIKGINLEIYKGEIHGLVGESGSGKSTLAKCIAGLLKSDVGSIKVSRLAMVFQDNYSSLNPARSVEWILKEALYLNRIRKKEEADGKIRGIMEEVELPYEYKDRLPAELSGGQRQRVGIALALLCNPELLIADEPVSALDVTIQRQIVELFLKLKERRNLTVLFISHDLRTVFRLCDRVSVMKDGRIMESGARNEIYFEPKTEYKKELLRSAGLHSAEEEE